MSLLASPSLQALLSETRILLNQKDPTSSFWTDAELTNYLNEGVRIYFTECVVNNEGYFTTQTSLDLVANQETVALPTDCFQVKNVWKKVSNGYIVLPYRNTMTEGYTSQGGTSSDSYLPYYYFQGNNLVFRPTPNFSETAGIQIEYIQFPDQMIYGGDTLTAQVSPIFKQLIVMYAVYKAKLKESFVNGNNLQAAPKMHLDELYVNFKEVISKRSKNPTFVIPFNPETGSY